MNDGRPSDAGLPAIPSFTSTPLGDPAQAPAATPFGHGPSAPAAQPPTVPFEYVTLPAPETDVQLLAHRVPVENLVGNAQPPNSVELPAGSPPWGAPPTVVAEVPSSASRSSLNAVIAFLVVVVGLFASLQYMSRMVETLTSINATNQDIHEKMVAATEGLHSLDGKTANVIEISDKAIKLQKQMGAINADMKTMVDTVKTIGTQMQTLNASLTTLEAEITAVADANKRLAAKLGGISTNLSSQAAMVEGMKGDLDATSTELGRVPGTLARTNARLAYVNKVMCLMGSKGLVNEIQVDVYFANIPNGSATIQAEVIPGGAWKC